MKIPAGSRVTSYLLHFDPTTKLHDDPLHRVSGTITFRSPIVGVFVRSAGLSTSDKYLSSDQTRYVGDDPLSNRSLDEGDFVAFRPDRKTIIVNLQAHSGADQIRIVTMKELP